MLSRSIRLFTWIDVEEVLLEEYPRWPQQLLDAHVYWDGLVLEASHSGETVVRQWLEDTFNPRIESRSDGAVLILEAVNGERRTLPISIEVVDETPRSSGSEELLGFQASFARPRNFRRAGVEPPEPQDLEAIDGVPVVAFHSYKGGVGRTLHAIALAKWLTRGGSERVLLVDGDFEAPGISWHWAERVTDPPVSYSDFLALLHADPDPNGLAALRLAADRVQQYEDDGLLVLPAFRSRNRWTTLEIRPEHVASADAPFALTDRLAQLGQACCVSAVVVDLRAGLSELSAGLLLDPRVHRVFVASPSAQSIEGTVSLLERLAESDLGTDRDDFPLASLVCSLVLEELLGTPKIREDESRLLEAGGRLFGLEGESEDDSTTSGPEPLRLFTPFDPRLVTLPLPWDEMIERLVDTGLVDEMGSLGAEVVSEPSRLPVAMAKQDLATRRRRLFELAESTEYAEQGGGEGFLVTRSLERLALDHRRDLPIVLMVGAKGAGKTYTYLQLMAAESWEAFVGKIDDSAEIADVARARIYGPLPPTNLGGEALALVERATARCSEEVLGSEPESAIAVRDSVRTALKAEQMHEGEWRWLWLDILAWRCGFEVALSGAGQRFAAHLQSHDRRVIAVVDGLEDLFQAVRTDVRQQVALRSLLQDVPDWLKQQSDHRVGLVVMIRRDLLEASIHQNSGQLLKLHASYALKWDDDEASRLALWLGIRSGALTKPAAETRDIRDWSIRQVEEHLDQLWGRKLGSPRSREARTTRWVLGALGDYNGQIQARDMVRLLRIASEQSKGDIETRWDDRLLTPRSIRGAIEECSAQKIKEIQDENTDLLRVFDRIRRAGDESRIIPFVLGELSLSADDRALLETYGVITEDQGKYYMAEIFRQGLGFKLEKGARPKVLSLGPRRS